MVTKQWVKQDGTVIKDGLPTAIYLKLQRTKTPGDEGSWEDVDGYKSVMLKPWYDGWVTTFTGLDKFDASDTGETHEYYTYRVLESASETGDWHGGADDNVIEIDGKKDATAMETVKNLFVIKTRDYVTEVDEQSIVLIKDTRDMKEDEELQTLARMIVDNMHTEAMVKVRVGYGNRVHNLQDIAKSYQEAKMALEVGRIFYAERETIAYSLRGIGRLIYQLPMSLCEMFIHEVFGDEVPDIFNEEINTTIQKFFENNLNISETARQLYVHRNTLVYRLERLEKAIGLDIRKFDDAMTFKIAMMVIAHMNQQKVEE